VAHLAAAAGVTCAGTGYHAPRLLRIAVVDDRAVRKQSRGRSMLKWALIFFIIALIAAAFGFTDIAAGAATIAKVLFAIFLIICVIFLVLGLMAARSIT
jgi:uncharacterized membrane protein YtjA (UPF0391 family)